MAIDRQRPRAEESCLVEIRPAGARNSRPPLFLVHPVGGHVLCYANLARHLDRDRPIYGLQARGHDGTEPFHPDIPSMAADYVEAIRGVRPNGPYHLCGWSMGGLVAYEMAQELTGNGEQVELLALLDCGPRNQSCVLDPDPNAAANNHQALRVFARDLGLTIEAPVGDGPPAGLEQILWSGQQTQTLDPDLSIDQLHQLYRLFTNNDRVMSGYRPVPYSGKVTLALPSDRDTSAHARASRNGDPTRGWGDLAADVEVFAVPGDHFTMVREPHVRSLAEQLNQRFRSAASSKNPAGTQR